MAAPNLVELHVWCSSMIDGWLLKVIAENNKKIRAL